MKDHKESQLVLGLIGLTSWIQRRLASALSVHGLGVSEYLVLRELSEAPDQVMRRIDLAERVGLSASGVTRLLNPMEKIGLVGKEESPRDARVSLVVLTPAGARSLAEASVAVDHLSTGLLAPLGSQGQAELQTLTQAIRSSG